jgi:hypothetical protein
LCFFKKNMDSESLRIASKAESDFPNVVKEQGGYHAALRFPDDSDNETQCIDSDEDETSEDTEKSEEESDKDEDGDDLLSLPSDGEESECDIRSTECRPPTKRRKLGSRNTERAGKKIRYTSEIAHKLLDSEPATPVGATLTMLCGGIPRIGKKSALRFLAGSVLSELAKEILFLLDDDESAEGGVHRSVISADIVKQLHLSVGRGYPRPTERCVECHGWLVCCWGKVHAEPYWRHVRGFTADCQGAKAGHAAYTITLVKRLLVWFLNAPGTTLLVANACPSCRKTTTVAIPRARFREDVSIPSVSSETTRIHISVPSGKNEKTAPVVLRAVDVLDALDKGRVFPTITIANHGSDLRCDHDAPQKLISYGDGNKCGTNAGCDSDFDFDETAVRLGYLGSRPRMACVFRRALYALQYHQTEMSVHWRVVAPIDQSQDYLSKTWKGFLAAGKCIRCRMDARVSFEKPYCNRCFGHLSKKVPIESIQSRFDSATTLHKVVPFRMDDARWETLRTLFAWMGSIPGWNFARGCWVCKEMRAVGRAYDDGTDEDAVAYRCPCEDGYCHRSGIYTPWLDGTAKNICAMCFHQKCVEFLPRLEKIFSL